MQKDHSNLRVALIHDFLTTYGGAERVLEDISEMFPAAPIYTLLYDKEKMRGKFSDRVVHASFLQKFPRFLKHRQKYLLPLLPVAPETFDLREYDLVISSSGAWTKGIITRLNTKHIAYIHSPMRFAWDVNEEYLKQQNRGTVANFLARKMLNYIRVWDKAAADRPDYLIANSIYTQKRISKYYGRKSTVIYPSVSLREQALPEKQRLVSLQADRLRRVAAGSAGGNEKNYFLVVSRLSPYKKIDAIIEAFNKLELPLVVVGEGSQKRYLESIAGKNIKFTGFLPDEKLPEIYSASRAFVFAGVDDFGITPVEAMSFGVPVLGVRKGGILETVEEGKTGEFFDADTPEVIADAVRRFLEKENDYNEEYIKKRAGRFIKERFIKEISDFLKKNLA